MTSSNNYPQEDVRNVELTCTKDTNDVVAQYQWFKDDGAAITGAESAKYQLPDKKRANSGDYYCKVIATNVPPSPKSDALTVTFLCKFIS